MRLSFVALAGVAILVAMILATPRVVAAAGSSSEQARLYAPPRELVQYGHVKSLVPRGQRFELRFDPAFWLGGSTANMAAVEDGAIKRGESVPNDYYIRDEQRRLLTYVVPRNVRVTVVTNDPSNGLGSTKVAVAELSQILAGRNPKGRQLVGRYLGFWMRVATDTVRSLDQQYQP